MRPLLDAEWQVGRLFFPFLSSSYPLPLGGVPRLAHHGDALRTLRMRLGCRRLQRRQGESVSWCLRWGRTARRCTWRRPWASLRQAARRTRRRSAARGTLPSSTQGWEWGWRRGAASRGAELLLFSLLLSNACRVAAVALAPPSAGGGGVPAQPAGGGHPPRRPARGAGALPFLACPTSSARCPFPVPLSDACARSRTSRAGPPERVLTACVRVCARPGFRACPHHHHHREAQAHRYLTVLEGNRTWTFAQRKRVVQVRRPDAPAVPLARSRTQMLARVSARRGATLTCCPPRATLAVPFAQRLVELSAHFAKHPPPSERGSPFAPLFTATGAVGADLLVPRLAPWGQLRRRERELNRQGGDPPPGPPPQLQ